MIYVLFVLKSRGKKRVNYYLYTLKQYNNHFYHNTTDKKDKLTQISKPLENKGFQASGMRRT